MGVQNLTKKLVYKVSMKGGQARLRELILYISEKCAGDRTFGATKLNKILFHSDFRSFERFGRPITGEIYRCLERGPAPAAMFPVRREMVAEGILLVQHMDYGGQDQHRPIPLRPADLQWFSGRDIALVGEVIEELWGKTATVVSSESHTVQWRTCRLGKDIPYQAAYLSDEPFTPGDIASTEELARELHWRRS